MSRKAVWRSYRAGDYVLLVVALGAIGGYFLLNHPTGQLHDLHTRLDSDIPVEPWFSIPYLMFLPVFAAIGAWAFIKDREFRWLALSVLLMYLVSDGFFHFFQTVVSRPSIHGHGLQYALQRYVYSSDKPYNDFPSTHASSAALLAIYGGYARWRWVLRGLMCTFSVVVIASTLFIKQHYIWDVVAGVLLACLASIASSLILAGTTTERRCGSRRRDHSRL